MIVHIQSVDMDAWDDVTNGQYQPQIVANIVVQDKPKVDWSDDDKKKVQYDLRTRNIIISPLEVNEYHSILHCKTAKAMWDAWKIFMREPTTSSNQRSILIQQYELFHMEDGESISSIQTRFTHIVKKLKNLGKDISNQNFTIKVYKCMTRYRQPKVTAIKESKNLNTVSITTLWQSQGA